MGYTVIFDAVHISLKGELGLFKSIMYFRSKRFFSIFWPFDVNLKWFDLWKHFRNVAWSFHSWKFQRVDYYTAWSNSTKFVEKRDLPNHGQTCGHRFADVNWRIPNPTLLRSRRVSWFLLCVAMAEQLCSNPWRNSFVEGKIWDHLSKMTQIRPKFGGGVILWYK